MHKYLTGILGLATAGFLVTSCSSEVDPEKEKAVSEFSTELTGELSKTEADCFARRTVDQWPVNGDFTTDHIEDIVVIADMLGDFNSYNRSFVARELTDDQLQAIEAATAECVDGVTEKASDKFASEISYYMGHDKANCLADAFVNKFSENGRYIAFFDYYKQREKYDYSDKELKKIEKILGACLDKSEVEYFMQG